MQQLDSAIAALHSMTDSPGADLTAQRKTYEKALSALEDTAEDVREKTTEMRERGSAYFAEWDAQIASIQNEEIRERSADRRKEIEKNLGELESEYNDVRTAFDPLLNDLRDIRTALKADSTMAGIDLLKPNVKRVDKERDSLRDEMKDLAEHFRELGVSLSRSGPVPPPTESK